MARILSIASTAILKTTRHLILQNAGYCVASFDRISLMEELEAGTRVDLAIVGHGFKGSDKRKIALTLNQVFPRHPHS